MISRPAPGCTGPKRTTPPTSAFPLAVEGAAGRGSTVPWLGDSAGAGVWLTGALPAPITWAPGLPAITDGAGPGVGAARPVAAPAAAGFGREAQATWPTVA